ncbi:MAG: hypothetical protein WC856_13360 [Methylococcaceae bacterium]|jgi:hypothetical protein
MKKLLIFFAAGCVGTLVNSITVWAFGNYGITKALGVSLAAEHFAWTARAIFFSLLFFSALSPSIDSYLAFF